MASNDWQTVFGSSRWNIHPCILLALRLVFALVMASNIPISMTCWSEYWGLPMNLYFLKWSFVNLWAQSLYHCLAALVTVLAIFKRCDWQIFQWLASATCILQAALSSSAITLPPAYFIAIKGVGTGVCGYSVLVTHGVNAVVFLLDIFLGRHFFPFYRVFWAIGFMCSYFAFSYVYTMNGGAPLYAWLDWNNSYVLSLSLSLWLGVLCPILVYGALAWITQSLPDRAQEKADREVKELESQP